MAGEEFRHELLEVIGALENDTLLQLLDEAMGYNVIEETDDVGLYRFVHPLMRQILVGRMSTARRLLLHHELGMALEDYYG